jgi:hypothetical protein
MRTQSTEPRGCAPKAKQSADKNRAISGPSRSELAEWSSVVDDVFPPLAIRVAAGRLEACPVADLDEEIAEFGVRQVRCVGVCVQDPEGAHGFGWLKLGADPAGFAVVGC